MREIKFRIWDTKEQIFLKEEPFIYCGVPINWFMPKLSIDQDRYIWLQFTGLRDKNSKEIYEGDVVNLPEDDEFYKIEIAFTVDRDFNGWEITPQHIEDGAEVLGNIHENPELLK